MRQGQCVGPAFASLQLAAETARRAEAPETHSKIGSLLVG